LQREHSEPSLGGLLQRKPQTEMRRMNASQWDRFFEWLADATPEEVRGFNRPPELDRAVAILARLACKKLLIVGAGPGEVPAVVAAGRLDVTAVDASVVALRWSRRYAVNRAARLVAGDARALPLADGAFDAAMVLTVLSLYESETSRRMAAELARVLASGGVVLCWHVLKAFPEYRRVQSGDGTLTPLYSELSTPYPGFLHFPDYYDEEGNALPATVPPPDGRYWCSWTLTGRAADRGS
jgi:SAM-dependent methyltransferase